MSNEVFYLQIRCECEATADSFTRVVRCVRSRLHERASYWVDMFDDPNPKATEPCLFFPPSNEDPQLWISERLAEWLVMFLSQNAFDWYASHGPIEEDEAVLRRIALEV